MGVRGGWYLVLALQLMLYTELEADTGGMLYGRCCYKLMYWESSNSSTFSVYALCNRTEPTYEAEDLSLKTWFLL